MHKVTLIGATGLIGNEVYQRLSRDSDINLTVVARRKHSLVDNGTAADNSDTSDSSDRTAWQVVNFDNLEAHQTSFDCDTLVIALGTTIKQAGSQQAFRKIDFDYAYQAATLAKQHGAKRIICITAVGASTQAKAFYSRIKGELEQALMALSVNETIIIRPSLLLGKRDHLRVGEQIGQWLAPIFSLLLRGALAKYRPVTGERVGDLICNLIAEPITPGARIIYPTQ